jgi:hypothetical protein
VEIVPGSGPRARATEPEFIFKHPVDLGREVTRRGDNQKFFGCQLSPERQMEARARHKEKRLRERKRWRVKEWKRQRGNKRRRAIWKRKRRKKRKI